LSAMTGEDAEDAATKNNSQRIDYLEELTSGSLKGKRFGVIKSLLSDSIYVETVDKIKKAGGKIIKFEPPQINLEGFLTLLNMDMKVDLPKYLKNDADKNITISSVEDVIKLNLLDSIKRAPYGQQLFEGIVNDSTTLENFETIKQQLNTSGIQFFKSPMDQYRLDAVLSINNYHAGLAAVAKYPCLTIPMGYEKTGEPIGLTFIGEPFQEQKLLQLGYAFEQLSKVRKQPNNYK